MEIGKNITFINDNNLMDTYRVENLCAFKFENNKYIVYTKNERDYDNNNIIYLGKIVMKNNKQYVCNLSFEENDKVKSIIRKMIGYSGDIYDAK